MAPLLLGRPCVVPALRACNSTWDRVVAVRRAQARAKAAWATIYALQTSTMPSVWDAVLRRYSEAQAQHASSSIETNMQLLEDSGSGVAFILKVAATLRDKPKPPAPSGVGEKEWRNPFLPYEEALWVQHMSPSHTLLLNKFNVVQHHLLVVTRQFESQLDPLSAGDMEATWAVMQCMPNGGLAFYNCGPASGASQPHKHIQLVPLPLDGTNSSSSGGGGDGVDPGPPIWSAIQRAFQGVQPWQDADLSPALPFAAFAVPLPPQEEVTPALLADAFARLLARCRRFVAEARQQRLHEAGGGGGGAAAPAGSAAALPLPSATAGSHGSSGTGGGPESAGKEVDFSYNMLLTRRFLLLVPRSAEADGPVSCNSVAFAGSFFVRSREEIEHVKSRGPMAILAAVGFPWH